MKESEKINGHVLKFTNQDKIFWPDEGFTKGNVIDYYNSMYKLVLPYLKDRPLSLKRNPHGITDHGFFQKDAPDETPSWVKRQPHFSDSANKEIDYIICNDKATLLYLANLGCIEMNPWHSHRGKLEHPDYLIIDIDPSEGNTFDQAIETALAVKQVLDGVGAPCYCKTSGSFGLHVYVPLGAKYSYDQAVSFAELIAIHTHELVPDFTSLERSLKKRGTDNIYIDFLQNRLGQTIASPYSLRPKPHAPIATPLEWAEVKPGLTIEQFNITTIQARVEKKGDLFAGMLKQKIDMAACLKKMGG